METRPSTGQPQPLQHHPTRTPSPTKLDGEPLNAQAFPFLALLRLIVLIAFALLVIFVLLLLLLFVLLFVLLCMALVLRRGGEGRRFRAWRRRRGSAEVQGSVTQNQLEMGWRQAHATRSRESGLNWRTAHLQLNPWVSAQKVGLPSKHPRRLPSVRLALGHQALSRRSPWVQLLLYKIRATVDCTVDPAGCA